MKECGSFIVEEETKNSFANTQTPLLHLGQGKGLNEAAGYISSPADTDKRTSCLLSLFCYYYFASFLVFSPTLGTVEKGKPNGNTESGPLAESRSNDPHLLPKLQS